MKVAIVSFKYVIIGILTARYIDFILKKVYQVNVKKENLVDAFQSNYMINLFFHFQPNYFINFFMQFNPIFSSK